MQPYAGRLGGDASGLDILRARRRLGITQAELSAAADRSLRQIERLEHLPVIRGSTYRHYLRAMLQITGDRLEVIRELLLIADGAALRGASGGR